MDPMTLGAVFELGKAAIEKIWPDPTKRSEEMRKLEELRQKGDLAALNAHVQLMLAQIEVNKEEAKSGSMFIAGWRPMVGWVGAIGLALAFIPKAIVITVLWAMQAYLMMEGCDAAPACDITTYVLPPFPDLGVTDLLGILGGILGIGGMRTFEKLKGRDTKRIGQ